MHEASHIAYADESYYTASRYRSLSVVTLEAAHAGEICLSLSDLLQHAGLRKSKWSKLRQARERFAALQMIDKVVSLALQSRLRVDTLIWDTEDRRHRVRGRDDIANLERMYYHLFRNVLQSRWPSDSTWLLCPDRNSQLGWATIHHFLDAAGFTISLERDLFSPDAFRVRLARDFSIVQICEAVSESAPLCQVADCFAGLGAYSHLAYGRYEHWLHTESAQLSLPLDFGFGGEDPAPHLSNSDFERCRVLHHLDRRCKQYKLRVGLKSSRGLRTYDPRLPINFWPYEPQHPQDRAPVRSDA